MVKSGKKAIEKLLIIRNKRGKIYLGQSFISSRLLSRGLVGDFTESATRARRRHSSAKAR
jgi:hypothetical protein